MNKGILVFRSVTMNKISQKKIVLNFIIGFLMILPSCAQEKRDKYVKPVLVGQCEGCEAVFEYGDKRLTSTDTLPGFHEEGTEIKVSGTVFQSDGKTPAPDVILYVYHTNQQGIYENKFNRKNWERRHGYIRGWVRTDRNGQYAFYTLKPGTYPDRSEPAHIHITVLEPDGKYYWLGSYHFEGDPLLLAKEVSPEAPRGGSSGLLKLEKEGELWTGNRDIVLGKNIPGYDR